MATILEAKSNSIHRVLAGQISDIIVHIVIQKTPLSEWNVKMGAILQDGRQKVTLCVFRFKMGHRYQIWMIVVS